MFRIGAPYLHQTCYLRYKLPTLHVLFTTYSFIEENYTLWTTSRILNHFLSIDWALYNLRSLISVPIPCSIIHWKQWRISSSCLSNDRSVHLASYCLYVLLVDAISSASGIPRCLTPWGWKIEVILWGKFRRHLPGFPQLTLIWWARSKQPAISVCS